MELDTWCLMMSKRAVGQAIFFILNHKHMSKWLAVEHKPDTPNHILTI